MSNALAALLLLSLPAAAAPLSREDVPAPLRAWVDWALRGRESETCPSLHGQETRHCAWPGTLRLALTEGGGQFSQGWRVYAETWVPLPGDAGRWPLDVTVDGSPAAVLPREGRPSVRLKPGSRSVAGRFLWDALPEGLEVARETGLVSLSVSGTPVAFPSRDEAGRLWLHKSRAAGPERAHLEVSVHRRLVDEVPLILYTHVQLRVSGRAREEALGRALPPGFVPMSVASPLPARLDPDGRLRVQARAGTWDVEIAARREGRSDELALGEPGGLWDADEAWAFESREALRGVSVEGVPAVDPQQTEMPHAWRRFPAYLMKPGATLKLVERRRGDAAPEADRLVLDRTAWLDFDGRGLTVRDRLSGTLARSWRLTMGAGTGLGRVAFDGQDQFLTALKPGGLSGVEARQRQLSAEADSRVRRRRFAVPAVGWAHDFERVSGRLNLPPGWRLVHAWGVDRAEPSWVTRWTLLDLFLVLILSFAVGRLWDRRWGAAALAAGALTWHEPGALRWLWLWALAAEALVRALPDGKVRSAARAARWGALGLAVLWLIPFAVDQVRGGLYPQLQTLRPVPALGRFLGAASQSVAGIDELGGAMPAPEPAAPEESDEFSGREEMASESELADGEGGKDSKGLGENLEYLRRKSVAAGFRGAGQSYQSIRPRDPAALVKAKNLLALDPRSAVATGPGVPDWQWSAVQLTWKGPVQAGQRMRLWLVGPRTNLLLALLRVALAAALLLLLMGLPVEEWLRSARSPGGLRRAASWLFPAVLLGLALPVSAADFPGEDLLRRLADRVLEAPDCAPYCAESPRLRLEASGGVLRLRMEVHASAPTAVPLPSGGRAWSPTALFLDGAAAPGARREADGTLWLPVTAGVHQVLIEGPLPDVELVPLSLPLKPRRVEAAASGWAVHGLREDGRADDSLQLSRLRSASGPAAARAGGALPPFVRVERTLRLGLSWEAETRVVRLTPAGAPVVLEVPLLAGESVTSDVAVKKGKAQVSLGPQAPEARWTSVLAETDRLELEAPDAVPWAESWRLEVGPVWHAEASGIPPVRGEGAVRALAWRPWPGESAAVALSRPAGVAGRTLTLDSASLTLSPGARAADARLDVALRSSRGAQHAFTLPEGADLQALSVDGAPLAAKAEGGKVVVPVQPGAHRVVLAWREPRGMSPLWRGSLVGLGTPAVNARVEVAMPADRWILALRGPRLGPAVLFWSLLAVLLLVSAGLGRLGLTPLDWRGWFLLSVGLSQVPVPAAAVVALWLVLLGWRGRNPRPEAREFDVLQVFLALLTPLALLVLFAAIKQGLLGRPEMQVGGNGSTASHLRWYSDRSGLWLPRPVVLSVPLGVYRLAMLAWALWLAHSLLSWIKWGWSCFAAGGLWKPLKALPEPPAP